MTATVIPAQRKDQDGSRAREHGINVPLIFESFAEAQVDARRGGTVIARTEHPTELNGVSGVNLSLVMSPGDHFGKDFIDIFCEMNEAAFLKASRQHHESWFHVKSYCERHGLSTQDYVAKLGYSYWEHVSGVNLFVVGDPALPERLRVFAAWPNDTWTYTVFDGEEYVSGVESSELQSYICDIVQMYRQVQAVFGNVCWVVEMQLSLGGELYFLQRSNGRSLQTVDWSFEVESDPHVVLGRGYGEVCGATPREGIEFDILLERSARFDNLSKDKPTAVLCSHINNTVIEQDTIEGSKAYIRVKKYLSHGPGSHSSVIPMAKSPLHLFAPSLVAELPEDMQKQIRELKDQKHTNAGRKPGPDGSVDMTHMARDYYENPDYMVRLRLNVRSDGREARITVLEMF